MKNNYNQTICGEDIPSWVNRLAYLTTFVPFIERVIPKEWISPMALQNTVESHMNEANTSQVNDGNGCVGSKNEQSTITDNSNRINNNNNSNNNSIWSAIFNNIEKIEQNK